MAKGLFLCALGREKTLVGVAPAHHSYEDVTAPYLPLTGKTSREEGPDGTSDLTFKFKTQDIVGALEALLGRELVDGEALVLTTSGTLGATGTCASTFTGEDVVAIISNQSSVSMSLSSSSTSTSRAR